jgi:uncharacterized membrane protein YbaN (DUF454 family)
VLGVILPLVPGVPFLILGVAMVGADHPTVRPFLKHIDRFKRRKSPPTSPDQTGLEPSREA